MDFPSILINWYRENKRDLPWRNTNDPYKIWLSEIILQQTRVDQGMSYYLKFIENYPTVKDLAQAKEEEVLKLWQGLGYYSRARNLHFTAKLIVNEYNGEFPNQYKDILNLKGIGEYTAAAIASFAYNNSYPVIDGNVYRVLSRIFGISTPIDSTQGKKEFKALAEELIDSKNPSEYNQAIMEFGALYCKPQTPDCDNCVFNGSCEAFNNKEVSILPVKSKKIKQKDRYFNYLVFTDEQSVYIKNRLDKDIWKGLFDFPLVETTQPVKDIEEIKDSAHQKLINQNLSIKVSDEKTHILSHQKIHAIFWLIQLEKLPSPTSKMVKIKWKEINNYPVPKLIENYLHQILKMSTFDLL